MMQQTTTGTVVSDTKLWWCKINRKPVRLHAMDGADFPHIIRVRYTVNGTEYTKRKFFGTSCGCPQVGQTVCVRYQTDHPAKCEIE